MTRDFSYWKMMRATTQQFPQCGKKYSPYENASTAGTAQNRRVLEA